MENRTDEVSYLKARCEELHCAHKKTTKDLEIAEKTICEMKDKIKFLEGQVEAYQYCLNSRFLR